MGKSVVLKDLTRRLAGYVYAGKSGVSCRMPLDTPAQLIVLFSDGKQKEYTVDAGGTEQHFDGECGMMSGCYVFCRDELLLFSDETMRAAFEKRRLSSASEENRNHVPAQRHEGEQLKSQPEKNKGPSARESTFPQRRWPPPPCWDTAQYRQGSWEEDGMVADDSGRDNCRA